MAKNSLGHEHCLAKKQNIPMKWGAQHRTKVPTTISKVLAALVSRRILARAWTSFFLRSFINAREDLLNALNELGPEKFMRLATEAVENFFFLADPVLSVCDLGRLGCIVSFVEGEKDE